MKGNERNKTAERIRTVKGSSISQKRNSKATHSRAAFVLSLATVLILALLITAKAGNIANAAEGTDDIEYKYYTTITVEKGETLWDIALENYSEKYYDSVDDYIDEVKTINGLKNNTIHEGAKLVIVYFSPEYK